MQARLRWVSPLFVAWLLWLSPVNATTQKVQAKKASPRYAGVASWYGVHHAGRKMANGQRFDPKKLTAACWYFPLGTELRVVNVTNGKSVQVTVTDRGPGLDLHRVIDLSEAAAKQLDYIDAGLTHVFLMPIPSARAESVEPTDGLIEPLSAADSHESAGPMMAAQVSLR